MTSLIRSRCCLLLAALVALAPAATAATAATVATVAADAPARVLSLDEALRIARDRQPQLSQAAAATQAAIARAAAAHAPLLPQVSGSGGYQRSTANFVSRPGALPRGVGTSSGSESFDTSPFFNLGLNASFLLYDFGQTRNRYRSSLATVESQKETERATLNQVFLAVRTSFFQARAAKELVSVARGTLANQQKHLEQTQGFVEVGTQAPIALAQTKTAVANAQVQLINAENGYQTAKAQLNQAMGVEDPADYDVRDEPLAAVEGEDGTTDALLAEAVKARPELASLVRQVQAQELTVRALRAAFGPALDVTSGYTDSGPSTGSLIWNWNAALVLSVPIYNGGQTRAQIEEGEANLASARSQLEIERLQVRLEVEQARLAVRAAKAALAASNDAVENAQDQLRLAEGRYETGIGSILELSDAQVALTSAAQQKVQAEYTLYQGRAQLVKALGRL